MASGATRSGGAGSGSGQTSGDRLWPATPPRPVACGSATTVTLRHPAARRSRSSASPVDARALPSFTAVATAWASIMCSEPAPAAERTAPTSGASGRSLVWTRMPVLRDRQAWTSALRRVPRTDRPGPGRGRSLLGQGGRRTAWPRGPPCLAVRLGRPVQRGTRSPGSQNHSSEQTFNAPENGPSCARLD